MIINIGEKNKKNISQHNSRIVEESNKSGKELAEEIFNYADTHTASAEDDLFQNKLDKIQELSPKELIYFFRSFSSNESIIELICDETGENRQVACLKVMNALAIQAEALKLNIEDLKKEFETTLEEKFKGRFNSYIDTENLDKILYAIVQLIETAQNFTPEELDYLDTMDNQDKYGHVEKFLGSRLNLAFESFGERIDVNGNFTNLDENGNLMGGQLQKDGWAGDIADLFSLSSNKADNVREDLKVLKSQFEDLAKASELGDEAYANKFKELFGVEFDYKKILASQINETIYLRAKAASNTEQAFNILFAKLLSGKPLEDEIQTVFTGEIYQTNTIATANQVFEEEFEKFSKFLGANGKALLEQEFSMKNAKSEKEKYNVMKEKAMSFSKKFHRDTQATLQGKTLESLEKSYNDSYRSAFGFKNDSLDRVKEYNESQQIGAMLVKGVVVAIISMATVYSLGTAAAPVAAFLGASGSATTIALSSLGSAAGTILTELSDDLTTTKALKAFKEGDLEELNNCVNWKETLTQAAIGGITVAGFGLVSHGVQILSASLSPAMQGLAMFSTNMALGAGTEYVLTGEISVNGIVMTGVFSIIAGVVTFHSAKVQSAINEAAKQQLEHQVNQMKLTLGIEDGVEITKDLLKQIKKESAYLHPDRHNGVNVPNSRGVTFSEIVAALEFLEKNIDVINNGVEIINNTEIITNKSEKSNLPSKSSIVSIANTDDINTIIKTQAVAASTVPIAESSVLNASQNIVSKAVPAPKVFVDKFVPITPKVNKFSGYRLADGSIDYQKFTDFLVETRRAPLTRENAAVKKVIDCMQKTQLESISKTYPLFTEYLLNALENGFAEYEANINIAMDYTYSDPALIKNTENYLKKGFSFNDIKSYNELERNTSLNNNLPKVVQEYSFETQKKYIDFLKTPESKRYSSILSFIHEHMSGEEFLVQCLDDINVLKEVDKQSIEAMKPFVTRTANTSCPLKMEDLVKLVNYYDLKTELMLMKMHYPEKYNTLINSEEFNAVLWNHKNSSLKLLNNIRHDLPITPTSIAGLQVSREVLSFRLSADQINGNLASKFNLSDRISRIKACLPDYTEKKGYQYKISPNANGGTKISLINSKGNVENIFESSSFIKECIGYVTQNFYDDYGKNIGSLTYESSGNIFRVKTSSGTVTLKSFEDFKNKFPQLRSKLSSEITNYIFVNDDHYQSRNSQNWLK